MLWSFPCCCCFSSSSYAGGLPQGQVNVVVLDDDLRMIGWGAHGHTAAVTSMAYSNTGFATNDESGGCSSSGTTGGLLVTGDIAGSVSGWLVDSEGK